ncbi:fimbrial protein [Metapseudomonas otitidis]|uniref:fimbrial protein n=1 Tax=Metapseudomonas otitidis TaxID=319939 RepID=UPI0024489966|nr:fimbrial protein [Pseudomonas otitidis]MDH0336852.1 fimbrial protein [Pseudomonas otitidis]
MKHAACRTLAAALALLLMSNLAWGASCTGSGRKTPFSLPTTLALQRDAPIGSVLYDTHGWIGGGGEASATCSGPGTIWMDHGYRGAMQPTPLPYVYESGVPGIGIKVAWSNNANRPPASMSGGVFMGYPLTETQISATTYKPAQQWWIQLIKIGPISSGTFKIAPIQVYYHNLLTNELTFPASQLVFNKQGCRMLNPAITVTLPTANLHHFDGYGSSAGERPFTIPLECDADIHVSYRVDGLQITDSVLKNSEGAGMAKGVGVQLLKGAGGGTPLVLGAKAYHLYTGEVAGLSVIPLIARYYQTELTMTPGAVITTATLTMFYE